MLLLAPFAGPDRPDQTCLFRPKIYTNDSGPVEPLASSSLAGFWQRSNASELDCVGFELCTSGSDLCRTLMSVNSPSSPCAEIPLLPLKKAPYYADFACLHQTKTMNIGNSEFFTFIVNKQNNFNYHT